MPQHNYTQLSIEDHSIKNKYFLSLKMADDIILGYSLPLLGIKYTYNNKQCYLTHFLCSSLFSNSLKCNFTFELYSCVLQSTTKYLKQHKPAELSDLGYQRLTRLEPILIALLCPQAI